MCFSLSQANTSQANASDATPSNRLLTDFGSDAALTWYTVNDNVMGGRSQGGFQVNDGVLRFKGSTNTNGGGFSSLRTRSTQLDLRAFEGVRLRVRADGRRYTFRLTTSTSSQGRYAPTYWADFETRKSEDWQSVDVPFRRFTPRWRGRQLDGPALDLANVNSLGLMIYDKLDGAFRMEVDSIHAYRTRAPFSLESVQWKQRPLLVFAPTASDARLARQLAAIAKDRSGFDTRDMLLIVVAPGASRVEQQALSSVEAKALRTRFRIDANAFAVRLVGKDGAVKRMSHEVEQLTDLFTQIDSMPMRQQEKKDADK